MASEIPQDLDDLYIDELKDLWSANDQMSRLLGEIVDRADDQDLRKMLEKSRTYIDKHTQSVRELMEELGEEDEPEHCKGMEGLVKEATRHIIEEGPEPGPVLDALIIAQYQRMSHYGLAGFGTAAAYAGALGYTEDQELLETITGEIYNGDEYASRLAETAVNIEAAADDDDAEEDEAEIASDEDEDQDERA